MHDAWLEDNADRTLSLHLLCVLHDLLTVKISPFRRVPVRAVYARYGMPPPT